MTNPGPPASTGGADSLASRSTRRLVGVHVLVIAAASLVWMAPLVGLRTGWWHTPNELNDLFRTHGVAAAWTIGVWDARFLPALDFGFGYPVLFFESPLYYWIGALLGALMGDLATALRVQTFVWTMVGALGAYALADRWWTRHALSAGRDGRAGLVAALAWLASPLGMVLLMIRGDGPAHAAAQLLPWVACLALGLAMRRSQLKPRDGIEALLLAAVLAMVCLLDATRVAAAIYVVLLLTGLCYAEQGKWSRRCQRGGLVIAACIVAAVMASWWWVPSFAELAHVQALAPAWPTVPVLQDLTAWRSVPAPLDEQSFRTLPLTRSEPMLGVLVVVAAISALLGLIVGRTASTAKGLWASLVPALLAGWLLAPKGEHSPVPPIADAARVLLSLAMVLAIPAMPVAWAMGKRASRGGAMVAAALMFVLLLGSLHLVGRTVPAPRGLWAGYFWDQRLVPRETTTSLDDYAPRWRARRDVILTPDLLAHPANTIIAPPGVSADKQSAESSRFELRVSNTTAATAPLTIALNYYPGWRALLESAGRELPVSPSPEGFVRVDDIPPGTHNLRLHFGTTPLRSAAWAVSIAAMIAWAAAMARLVWLAREAAQRVPMLAGGDDGDRLSATMPRPLMESAVVSLPASRNVGRRVAMVVLAWALLMGALGQRWSFLFDSWLAVPGVWLARLGDVAMAPVSTVVPRLPNTTPPPGLSLIAACLWLAGLAVWFWLARRVVRWWQRRASTPAATPPAAPAPDDVADPSRRALLGRAVALAPLAVGGSVGGYSVLVEPDRLVVAEYDEAIADLPAALDGLRVVQLSDLHLGPYMPAGAIRRALHRARELKPDLVLLTGDFVHRTHGNGFGMVAKLIADNVDARLGIVASLGNHDHYEGAHLARRAFAPTGIPVIDNTRVFLTERGVGHAPSPDALCLAGVGDLWTDRVLLEPALADVPNAMPRLLLSHNPDVAEYYRLDADRPPYGPAGQPYWVWHNINKLGKAPAAPPRIDLMLAGHTHGGQVRVPGLGTPIVPSNFGQKYAGGRIAAPHWPVIVSRGVGMAILPVRFGVPPEIGLIVLKRREEGGGMKDEG